MLSLASLVLCAVVLNTAAVEVHGDVHNQIARLDVLVKDEPGDAGLYLRRAKLHREDENWTAAAADLARASQLAPSLDGLSLEQAYLAAASGRVPVRLKPYSAPNFGPAPGGRGIYAAVQPMVPSGADWKYKDDGNAPTISWRQLGYNDASWQVGAAELGYGDGDEVTVVGFGPNAAQKFITTWFRHQFQAPLPLPTEASIAMIIDDGAVVYLNGVEIVRHNIAPGLVTSATFASVGVNGVAESAWVWFDIPAGALVSGANQLAVEVHQVSVDSSDISMDLVLLPEAVPDLARQPYLQAVSSDAATLRWRTLLDTDSVVWWGPAPGGLVNTLTVAGAQQEHEVRINGLTADSTVYYAVGDSSGVFAGDDLDHRFRTPPAAGTNAPLRAWILGDSGEVGLEQEAVRDAFLAWETVNGEADLLLLLGDNAYPDGTESAYQDGFFEPFQDILQRLPAWAARGNHDLSPAAFASIFAPPIAGECGGVPSGTESYYSFNWGDDVHFVCIDSWESDRNLAAPMALWLEADLAANDATWTVVFFHHPPYTRGNHNSDDRLDSGGRLVEMRQRFLPILENYGVDLVLNGHSHSYERSMLLQGHYGPSLSLLPEHQVDSGDGRLAGDGPYRNLQKGLTGTVYAVGGSSSHTSTGGTLDHPVMIESLLTVGSMILEIDGPRLDLRFLDGQGVERDHFTMYTSDGLPKLRVAPAYAGAPLNMLILNMRPGADFWLYSSSSTGNAVVPQGISSLSANPTLLTQNTADARGQSSFNLFVPAGASGLSRTLQPVEAAADGSFLFGATVTVVVQ